MLLANKEKLEKLRKLTIWIVVAIFVVSWADSIILVHRYWTAAGFSQFWAVMVLATYPLPCVLMFSKEDNRGLLALVGYLPAFFAIRMIFSH